ncbi:hypothetical protein [Sorangium cellulosum]|uniref:hypothetical protein n=1 Tax=Sorangium cellulosum TaxID=56 RepID=UPI00031FAD94|nr:hypothetical protein [Sorangium cellulosum]
MQKHHISNETVAGHVSADNIQPPDAIDVRISVPSTLVVALVLIFLWLRSRRARSPVLT